MTVRVIPRLDIKGTNLVKGIHLEGLRVLGRPQDYARLYYEEGADELLYMDAVASLYGRNSLLGIVEATSREVFIPLCVGGGLRTLDDIREALRAGADKISMNTAALADPELVTRAARRFGSSTIVVSIEAIRQPDGSYQCFTDAGREATGVDAFAWAAEAAERGAGELLITSVDRDGTGRGFDLDLIDPIARAVPIPVIASGGAGSADHVAEVVAEAAADAVAVASILHYDAAGRLDLDPAELEREGNVEYLRTGQPFSRIHATPLAAIKAAMAAHGIEVRR